MSDTPAILVATSIAPGPRIDMQRLAIASWLDHGLDVVSLNAPDEIAILAPHFTGIRFQPVERTAKLLTGRQHIFIDDILRHLAASGAPIVGIVNSDIQIDIGRASLAQIAETAKDGLVSGPRLDVTHQDDTAGRIDPFGYDAFFFSPSSARLWTNTRFCLGQGYWDHWLPLMALVRGHPTYKLRSTIGRHVAHEIARDDNFFIFADEFAGLATGFMRDATDAPQDWQIFGSGFPKHAYADLRRNAEAGGPGAVEAFARYIDELTRYVIRFIDTNAQRLDFV